MQRLAFCSKEQMKLEWGERTLANEVSREGAESLLWQSLEATIRFLLYSLSGMGSPSEGSEPGD